MNNEIHENQDDASGLFSRERWPLYISIFALAFSAATYFYTTRAAHIVSIFDSVTFVKDGTPVIPITFTNEGAHTDTIEEFALVISASKEKLGAMAPIVTLHSDRLPAFGTKGAKDTDYIESPFVPFAVGAGESVTKVFLFAEKNGQPMRVVPPTCLGFELIWKSSHGYGLETEQINMPRARETGTNQVIPVVRVGFFLDSLATPSPSTSPENASNSPCGKEH